LTLGIQQISACFDLYEFNSLAVWQADVTRMVPERLRSKEYTSQGLDGGKGQKDGEGGVSPGNQRDDWLEGGGAVVRHLLNQACANTS
jgi:hypothetical protein